MSTPASHGFYEAYQGEQAPWYWKYHARDGLPISSTHPLLTLKDRVKDFSPESRATIGVATPRAHSSTNLDNVAETKQAINATSTLNTTPDAKANTIYMVAQLERTERINEIRFSQDGEHIVGTNKEEETPWKGKLQKNGYYETSVESTEIKVANQPKYKLQSGGETLVLTNTDNTKNITLNYANRGEIQTSDQRNPEKGLRIIPPFKEDKVRVLALAGQTIEIREFDISQDSTSSTPIEPKEILSFTNPDGQKGAQNADVSADGKHLIVAWGPYKNDIDWFEIDDNYDETKNHVFLKRKGEPECVRFSQDGKKFLVCGHAGRIDVYVNQNPPVLECQLRNQFMNDENSPWLDAKTKKKSNLEV